MKFMVIVTEYDHVFGVRKFKTSFDSYESAKEYVTLVNNTKKTNKHGSVPDTYWVADDEILAVDQ